MVQTQFLIGPISKIYVQNVYQTIINCGWNKTQFQPQYQTVPNREGKTLYRYCGLGQFILTPPLSPSCGVNLCGSGLGAYGWRCLSGEGTNELRKRLTDARKNEQNKGNEECKTPSNIIDINKSRDYKK